MKSIKRLLVVLMIMASMGGCASFGVWSATAQANITKAVAFYNQYLAGVLQAAPAILTEASTLLGAKSQVVTDATAAITAATEEVVALNAVAQNGIAANDRVSNVAAAITAVNTSVGAVQAAIAQAKGK